MRSADSIEFKMSSHLLLLSECHEEYQLFAELGLYTFTKISLCDGTLRDETARSWGRHQILHQVSTLHNSPDERKAKFACRSGNIVLTIIVKEKNVTALGTPVQTAFVKVHLTLGTPWTGKVQELLFHNNNPPLFFSWRTSLKSKNNAHSHRSHFKKRTKGLKVLQIKA